MKQIGYLGYSITGDEPGDRRRFIWYAKEANINYKITNLEKEYPIVYVTYGNNLSKVIEYKKKYPKTKIIFELTNAYLHDRNILRIYLRGLVRYILKKELKYYFNYNNLIRKIFKISDAVVCSTEAQKEIIIKFNKNTHISLDYMNDEYKNLEIKEKRMTKIIQIFWEGKIFNLYHLKLLNRLSKNLREKIHLHIVTDKEKNIIGKLYRLKRSSIVNKFKFKYTTYDWSIKNVQEIANKCSIGIIPILKSDKVAINKPENKLILMWTLGLQVITSKTRAYSDTMNKCAINNYCTNISEWEKKIERIQKQSLYSRNKSLKKIRKLLEDFYSKEKYMKDWESIFNSLSD